MVLVTDWVFSGNMESLARLNLADNKLKTLPDTLAMCPLKTILVCGNSLHQPPQTICDKGKRPSSALAVRGYQRFHGILCGDAYTE